MRSEKHVFKRKKLLLILHLEINKLSCTVDVYDGMGF